MTSYKIHSISKCKQNFVTAAADKVSLILAYLERQCTKISRSWVDGLIIYVPLFGDIYLARCNLTIDPTANMHQILCKSRKRCNRHHGNNWTRFRGKRDEAYMGV
jgi:hypothetical protein